MRIVKYLLGALALGAASASALLIGGAPLVLGTTWPSDVIGGWALGLAWVLLVLRLAKEDKEHETEIKEKESKPVMHHVETSQVKEEKPKEKKSRFGFFGKKRTEDDRAKKESKKDEKHEREEKLVEDEEEAETVNAKQDQRQTRDNESNLKEDNNNPKQETGEEKVVYLTDEDIEDLLK